VQAKSKQMAPPTRTIHLWCPHGGGRVRLRWMHADGERVNSMLTSTQKIRAHWRHPVFFSCKEVGGFWTSISSIFSTM